MIRQTPYLQVRICQALQTELQFVQNARALVLRRGSFDQQYANPRERGRTAAIGYSQVFSNSGNMHDSSPLTLHGGGQGFESPRLHSKK